MLKVRIIPVLLLRNWGIVKSVKFSEIRVVGDPTTNARVFNQRNADELVFLDIMASRENKKPNFEVIKNVTRECFMPMTFGGGISTIEDIDQLFDIGADKISVNTCLFENPALIRKAVSKYGTQAIVASIDADNSTGSMQVMTGCGLKNTGLNVLEAVRMAEDLGVGEILLNSIDRDGTAQGYDLNLIRAVADNTKLPVIVCGGCGKLSDFKGAIDAGASAVSAATIFYYVGESIITIKDYLHKEGYPVRLI
jgi:cyclase